MPRPLEVLLTVAATALGVAFFLSVPHWPRSWTQRPPVVDVTRLVRGPSILAAVPPAPSVNLSFPDDVATVIARRGIDGETGLIPTGAAIRTYRLRATGDVVTVGPIGAGPVRRVAADAGPSLLIRGEVVDMSSDRGITTLRWTEDGVTYEISSRTLDPARLADVAGKLQRH